MEELRYLRLVCKEFDNLLCILIEELQIFDLFQYVYALYILDNNFYVFGIVRLYVHHNIFYVVVEYRFCVLDTIFVLFLFSSVFQRLFLLVFLFFQDVLFLGFVVVIRHSFIFYNLLILQNEIFKIKFKIGVLNLQRCKKERKC